MFHRNASYVEGKFPGYGVKVMAGIVLSYSSYVATFCVCPDPIYAQGAASLEVFIKLVELC